MRAVVAMYQMRQSENRAETASIVPGSRRTTYALTSCLLPLHLWRQASGAAASATAEALEHGFRTHGWAYGGVGEGNGIVVEGFGCTVAAEVRSIRVFEALFEFSQIVAWKMVNLLLGGGGCGE